MRRVNAYQADNGELERDVKRAKAHDIAMRFDKIAKDKAIGTSGAGVSKIDWHAAMEILSHPEMLIEQLQEYITARESDAI
jgi:ferritin-like protein